MERVSSIIQRKYKGEDTHSNLIPLNSLHERDGLKLGEDHDEDAKVEVHEEDFYYSAEDVQDMLDVSFLGCKREEEEAEKGKGKMEKKGEEPEYGGRKESKNQAAKAPKENAGKDRPSKYWEAQARKQTTHKI